MTAYRVVVIGTSAGGVEALTHLVANLPADFAAPILVVLHIPSDSPSMLAQILDRRGVLRAKDAVDGEIAQPRTVYVAPPDRHLLIDRDGTLSVVRGPKENRHRPAIDPMFRSAALAYGRAAIGVVLTGTLDDGTAGLVALRGRGGLAIVQDPADAMYPAMPQNAINHVEVDHIVPLRAIGPLLARIVETAPSRRHGRIDPGLVEMETRIAEMEPDAHDIDERPGSPSAYSCPECHGVLWEIEEGELVRFRCRVGHAYSPESMVGALDETLETALWSAIKTLDESARLANRLAMAERARGHDWIAIRFEEREREARERATVIRQFLLRQEGTVPIPADEHL